MLPSELGEIHRHVSDSLGLLSEFGEGFADSLVVIVLLAPGLDIIVISVLESLHVGLGDAVLLGELGDSATLLGAFAFAIRAFAIRARAFSALLATSLGAFAIRARAFSALLATSLGAFAIRAFFFLGELATHSLLGHVVGIFALASVLLAVSSEFSLIRGVGRLDEFLELLLGEIGDLGEPFGELGELATEGLLGHVVGIFALSVVGVGFVAPCLKSSLVMLISRLGELSDLFSLHVGDLELDGESGSSEESSSENGSHCYFLFVGLFFIINLSRFSLHWYVISSVSTQ